jgi:hypothetical protein
MKEQSLPKPWWRSTSVKGSLGGAAAALAVLIVAVAQLAGYDIDLTTTELLIGALFSLVSAFFSWWGRVHATGPISTTQILPGISVDKEEVRR